MAPKRCLVSGPPSGHPPRPSKEGGIGTPQVFRVAQGGSKLDRGISIALMYIRELPLNRFEPLLTNSMDFVRDRSLPVLAAGGGIANRVQELAMLEFSDVGEVM